MAPNVCAQPRAFSHVGRSALFGIQDTFAAFAYAALSSNNTTEIAPLSSIASASAFS